MLRTAVVKVGAESARCLTGTVSIGMAQQHRSFCTLTERRARSLETWCLVREKSFLFRLRDFCTEEDGQEIFLVGDVMWHVADWFLRRHTYSHIWGSSKWWAQMSFLPLSVYSVGMSSNSVWFCGRAWTPAPKLRYQPCSFSHSSALFIFIQPSLFMLISPCSI